MPPPKPVAPVKPGKVIVYRALYPYTAQRSDELSFEEGDLLYVQAKMETGWWKATINCRSGLIPGNYVEESGNAESVDHPLHDASKRGNLPFLRECLANGVSPNALDKAGATPLHWAARGAHLDCVEELLKQPTCKVDVQNKLGDTPLHNAAWKGSSEVVKCLLEKGANKTIRNEAGQTPYNLANDPECGRLLKVRITAAADNDDYGDSEDED